MSMLLAHKGGHIVTKDDLALVPVPEATESYLPVPHNHLADTLSRKSSWGTLCPTYPFGKHEPKILSNDSPDTTSPPSSS